MALNRNKGQDFDEFFGPSRRIAPARESYSSREDVFAREDSFTRSERDRSPEQPTRQERYFGSERHPGQGSRRPSEGGRGYDERPRQSGQPDGYGQGGGQSYNQGGRAQAVRQRFGNTNGHAAPMPPQSRRDDIPDGWSEDLTDDYATPRDTGRSAGGRFRPRWNEPRAKKSSADDSWAYAAQPEEHEQYDYRTADGGFFEPPERKKLNMKKALITALCVLIGAVCIALSVFLLRPTDGGGYYAINGSLPMVEQLRQTKATNGSVTLDWEPVEAVAGYRIYRTDVTGNPQLVKTVYLSRATISGLGQGTSAQYTVSPFCKDDSGEYVEREAATVTAKTMPGKAGALEHADATDGSITLEWDAAAGADGYELQQYISLFRYEDCGDVSEARITIPVAEASTSYTYRMRPYIDLGGERCFGKWSEKFTSASSPKAVHDLVQGDTTDNGYVLNWAVDSEVTGFELYRADPDTGEATELLSQCGNTYYQISGLESVNYSSYRVRGFLRHEGGISYGEFSPVVTAVTLPTRVKAVEQYTAKNGAYTISWQPSERAEGYELYAYSCHTGEYDLLTTVAEPHYTIAGLTEYAERYKVRAYCSLGDLQFYGDYSDELPCYPYYYLKRTVTVDKDTTGLHTYSGPEHELITTLTRGTEGRVIGERGGSDGSRWFNIELADGTIGWLTREDVSITNICGTLATREYTDENPIVIYLSPSKQDKNFFWNNLTTEKEQMEAVGKVVHRILEEEYNCVVYTAQPHLELRERAFEAMELRADVYLAIHSNATGTADVHYGASSYYCGASGRSKNLGQTIVDKLGAIAPRKCTLYKQMYSALESFGGVGYAEVRDPYNLGMVTVLAETDFHDNELTGQWIIDNHEAIGRAYAEALAETFDIERK